MGGRRGGGHHHPDSVQRRARRRWRTRATSFISADVAMVPATHTALTDPDDLKKMGHSAGPSGRRRRRAERLAQPGKRRRPGPLMPRNASRNRKGEVIGLWPSRSFATTACPTWTSGAAARARTAGKSFENTQSRRHAARSTRCWQGATPSAVCLGAGRRGRYLQLPLTATDATRRVVIKEYVPVTICAARTPRRPRAYRARARGAVQDHAHGFCGPVPQPCARWGAPRAW